jgi:hypothetical protein
MSLDGVLFVELLIIVHAPVKHLTGSSGIKRGAPLLSGGSMRMVRVVQMGLTEAWMVTTTMS